MALKFTVHVVQSFIKGHRKSGVISIKYSRDMTNVRFLPVTATTYVSKSAALTGHLLSMHTYVACLFVRTYMESAGCDLAKYHNNDREHILVGGKRYVIVA